MDQAHLVGLGMTQKSVTTLLPYFRISCIDNVIGGIQTNTIDLPTCIPFALSPQATRSIHQIIIDGFPFLGHFCTFIF